LIGLFVLCALGFGAASVGVFAAGCDSEPLFIDCLFDAEVSKAKICSGTGGGAGNTSCVVTEHPQCARGICLSYFGKGNGPFCTQICLSNADCPGDAFCWSYDAKSKYCVPKKYQN